MLLNEYCDKYQYQMIWEKKILLAILPSQCNYSTVILHQGIKVMHMYNPNPCAFNLF